MTARRLFYYVFFPATAVSSGSTIHQSFLPFLTSFPLSRWRPIYVFDVSLEAGFIHAVLHASERNDDSFGVKQDPGFLIYFVDEDRDDSPTGMVEFLSYHEAGPWKRIIS